MPAITLKESEEDMRKELSDRIKHSFMQEMDILRIILENSDNYGKVLYDLARRIVNDGQENEIFARDLFTGVLLKIIEISEENNSFRVRINGMDGMSIKDVLMAIGMVGFTSDDIRKVNFDIMPWLDTRIMTNEDVGKTYTIRAVEKERRREESTQRGASRSSKKK